MTPRVQVTVVVPVHNSRSDLLELLACLRRQTLARTAFEVVVADDGSTDGTPDGLDGPGVVVLRGARGNAYTARNRALEHGRGQAIAFCDADCRPQPDWLEQGLAALEDADLAAGHIRLVGSGRASVWSLVDVDGSKDHERQVKLGNAETANLFVRARVFDDIGAFDDSQPAYGDFEFVLRAVSAGNRLTYAPKAIVAHPIRESARSYVKNVWEMHRSYAEHETRNGRRPDGLKLRSWMPVVQTVRGRRRVGRPIGVDRARLHDSGIAAPLHRRLLALPIVYVLQPYLGCVAQLAGATAAQRRARTDAHAAGSASSGA